MTAEGTLIAGRYRLTKRLGSGAMGVVWEAVDERLNRTVAVKQLLLQPGLSPEERHEAVERTMREGRIAARLHHPNAIGVFDVVDDAGAPCLIMEYLPSRSLDDVIHERGPLAPTDVATIGAQVASALTAAHAAGIVHRDIKPGNVLLGRNGQVKITDFGISRATDDITVTKTGLIAGTPAYLAPEVAIGRDPEPPSDMFSLGSTLYAATEGQPPFGLSDNTLSLLHVVARGQINPPRQSGPLTPVLEALLRADPATRPTAREAAQMLRAVARGQQPEIAGAAAPTAVMGGGTAIAPPATRALTQVNDQPYDDQDYDDRYDSPANTGDDAKRRRKIIAAVIGGLVLLALILGILFASGAFRGSTPSSPTPTAPTKTEQKTSTEPTTTTDETTTEEQPTTTQPTTTTTERTTTTEPTTTTTTTENKPTTTSRQQNQGGQNGLPTLSRGAEGPDDDED